MTRRERLKARDALVRKYRQQGKSARWIASWMRGWNNRGFRR